MKKNLLVFFLILGTFVSFSQEIKWKTFTEAQKEQENSSKDIFLFVGISKTHPLDKNYIKAIEADKELMKFLNENYILAFFTYDTGEEINYKGQVYRNPNLNRRGKCYKRDCSHDFVRLVLAFELSPSYYVFGKNGKMSEPIVGVNTTVLLEILKSFKEYEK